MYLLAAILGLSAGVALMSAILVEVIGYMVLLIPARIKQLKAEGHAEGHKAGREEERQEWLAWYERQQVAFREGIPFNEPPPAGPQGRNGK